MLDNKNLTERQKEGLRYLPYDEQIKTYDRMCAGCSFRLIQTQQGDKIITHSSIVEAIDVVLADEHAHILRSCCYGGDKFSLEEIVTNTCRLWNSETQETGIDNPDNDEFAFTEMILEKRSVRKSRVDEIISQLESAEKVSS